MPAKRRKSLKDGAKYFGRQLGRARDLDVLLEGYLAAKTVDAASMPALEALRALAEAGRDVEYDLVQKELSQGRFQDFLNDLKSLAADSWPQDQTRDIRVLLTSPIKELAAATLVAGARHLRKMDPAWANLSNDGIHKLRRRIKKARYQLRFLISVCDSERANELMKLLGAMQECLGRLRDVTQSRRLIADLVDQAKATDYAAILEFDGVLTMNAAQNFREDMKAFDLLWQRYLDLEGLEQKLISL